MASYKTTLQNNYGWSTTFQSSGRYPVIADRIFETLSAAKDYVNTTGLSGTAIPGLIISVIADPISSNNGVYYVKSVANDIKTNGLPIQGYGELVKVGGIETQIAQNYTAAKTLSQSLSVGQIIKVLTETIADDKKYPAGFYIVDTPGTIKILKTEFDSSEVKIESNTTAWVTVDNYNGQGSVSNIISIKDFDPNTSDICVNNYYPFKREVENNAVNFYYYIPINGVLNEVSLLIQDLSSYMFEVKPVCISEDELTLLFTDPDSDQASE